MCIATGLSQQASNSYILLSAHRCIVQRHEDKDGDACRVWPALVSALFFNIHSFLFAPLFTNFMGMGDKETFPFALIAHDYPYTTIKHHTYTVGLQKRVCSFRGIGGCWCVAISELANSVYLPVVSPPHTQGAGSSHFGAYSATQCQCHPRMPRFL